CRKLIAHFGAELRRLQREDVEPVRQLLEGGHSFLQAIYPTDCGDMVFSPANQMRTSRSWPPHQRWSQGHAATRDDDTIVARSVKREPGAAIETIVRSHESP